MTIGIAAYGPGAGGAVFEALRVAERAGLGSIGGFAVFAAIADDGAVLCGQTQRGGTSTLFLDGEITGAAPPDRVAAARIAAAISSGPDRPEPLGQFLAVDGAIGIVTGHRLPNQPGASGRPLNAEVLSLIGSGLSPEDALDRVLANNPEADAGMIAVALDGSVAARNARRVERRSDLGAARRGDGERRALSAPLPRDQRAAPGGGAGDAGPRRRRRRADPARRSGAGRA